MCPCQGPAPRRTWPGPALRECSIDPWPSGARFRQAGCEIAGRAPGKPVWLSGHALAAYRYLGKTPRCSSPGVIGLAHVMKGPPAPPAGSARAPLVGLPGFEPGRETPVLGFFGPSSGLGEHTQLAEPTRALCEHKLTRTMRFLPGDTRVTTGYPDLPYRRSPVPVGSESYRVPASADFRHSARVCALLGGMLYLVTCVLSVVQPTPLRRPLQPRGSTASPLAGSTQSAVLTFPVLAPRL